MLFVRYPERFLFLYIFCTALSIVCYSFLNFPLFSLHSTLLILFSSFCYLILFFFVISCWCTLYIKSVRSMCVYIVTMAHNDNNLESHFQYHWMIYVMLVVGHCLTSVSKIQYCSTFNMLKSSLFSIRPISQSKITFFGHKHLSEHLDKVKVCLKKNINKNFKEVNENKEERKYSNMDNIINRESMEEYTWYAGS